MAEKFSNFHTDYIKYKSFYLAVVKSAECASNNPNNPNINLATHFDILQLGILKFARISVHPYVSVKPNQLPFQLTSPSEEKWI